MVYWLITALQTKETLKRQSGISRFLYLGLMIPGFWLIYGLHDAKGLLALRILPHTQVDGILGVTINLIGIGFALFARIWLGRNWSGTVTIKKDHELIRTGPYSITRHPIYSGILFGMMGSVIVLGELRGLISILALFLALESKIRVEEKFLNGIFPQYREYCSSTQKLIPFIY